MKQSALLTLYFAHTIDCAVNLYRYMGQNQKADSWAKIAAGIKVAAYSNCWDAEKQLFRDYPDQQIYSQHTNLMAILCDVVAPADQQALLNRLLTYNKFDEYASSYFAFFLFKAMQKTGQEDLVLENLNFWYTFIDRGHTTCGETGFDSHDRSDCHAWSAHPAYYLLSSVCGIKPAEVGFQNVVIEPHLGKLTSVKASMPHPKGKIAVDYKVAKDKLSVSITLPGDMQGEFRYKNQVFKLTNGVNQINLK
jgi:hypothetical protein